CLPLLLVRVTEDRVWVLFGAHAQDHRASFLAYPVRPELREIDPEVFVEVGLNDVRRAVGGLERTEAIAIWVLTDGDHRAVPRLGVGGDDHAERVPRDEVQLRPPPQVVPAGPDVLTRLPDLREEGDELIGIHALAVVGDVPAVYALRRHAVP